MQGPPPEILHDTPTQFSLPLNSQIILQCKCRSFQKPTTIKWFRRKDDSYIDNPQTFESYQSFVESSRSIKYFENFYEPIQSSVGQQQLNEIYLSKLQIDVVKSSIYVCVAINYFGYSFRESFIDVILEPENVEKEFERVLDFPEKNYQILFLIPLVLLMPISMFLCSIFYLLINRQILKRNKIPETIFL